MESDKRKWHVSKEIPVALIVSMVASVFLGGVAYQSLKGNQEEQAKQLAAQDKKLESIEDKMGKLSEKMNDSNVPSAIMARRVDDLERERASSAADRQQMNALVMQLAARVGENERKLSAESMRNRAARER